jgi:RNA polymerase sigma factor (sigma-70 family)
MNTVRAKVSETSNATWSDERLVHECLKGSEEAWSALIEKYKNLIFSIPIKYGVVSDEAAEIFQEVSLLILSELPRLREPRALPAWLIRITSQKCSHWRRKQQRYVSEEAQEQVALSNDLAQTPERILQEVQREQMLREALAELSPRCQQLIGKLFFQSPALPYQEVAKSLEVATGSIGFMRMRCLERLRRTLEKKGFR